MSLRELPPLDASDDALLRELAAMAPVPEATFAAELDERVAAGFREGVGAGASAGAGVGASPGARRVAAKRGRRLHLRLPSLGPLLGTSLAAIFVIAIVVIALVRSPAHDATDGSPAASTTAGQTAKSATAVIPMSSSSAAAASGTSSGASASIARDTSLAITAGSGRFDVAAARVPQIVAAAGGTVASSIVEAGSSGDHGSFALRVPSGRYESVLAQLSQLGRVTRRSEQTEDVTAAIVTAEDRLGDLRAERESLRRRLAATTDDARAVGLRDRLAAVRRQIARQRAEAVNLHQRARQVPIRLELSARHATTGGATPSGPGSGDRGRIAQALHDAGQVLTSIGAIAIVALAVLVPLGLVLALVWRGAALLRRRRREQGLTG
jgi:hypothetical protein